MRTTCPHHPNPRLAARRSFKPELYVPLFTFYRHKNVQFVHGEKLAMFVLLPRPARTNSPTLVPLVLSSTDPTSITPAS